MSDEMQPCTSAVGTPTLQEKEETNEEEEEEEDDDDDDEAEEEEEEEEEEDEEEEEEEIDIYDPGDSDPYTREYIYKHEPFRKIPSPYRPDVGFSPSCLVFGVGLLRNEAVAYAEEHQILGPPGAKYSPTSLLLGYQDVASHFAELYGHRIKAVTVVSRKCDIVLAFFDNYSRPEDVETRQEVRDMMWKLVKIFPAARERRGWFYWAINDSMYPQSY